MQNRLAFYGVLVVAALLVWGGVWQFNQGRERTVVQSDAPPATGSNVFVAVDPPEWDLGTVVYGEVAHAEFTLTNFTPQLLKVMRVSTSCGCTKAEVEQEVLQPYESTAVKVSFDPAVHGENAVLGDLTREIYINTDNPDYSRITVQISASVVKGS